MIEIIHKLRLAKGTNAKLKILKQEADNEEWKKFLKATYDTSINYFASPPKDNTFIESFNSVDFHSMLNDLSSRILTGNSAKEYALLGSQIHGELFRLALAGSIKAGVSTTTINKAYPGLIPTFDVMLAKDIKHVSYPQLASIKYDGVRLLVHVENGASYKYVTAYTRAGKIIFIESLYGQMKHQPEGWYDGELVSGEGLQVGRTSITGAVNKCLKGTATDIEDYKYKVFDWISEQEWTDRVCETPYWNRYMFLVDHFKSGKNVDTAEQLEVRTDTQVQEIYRAAIAIGYEGLILRGASDPYEWKRTPKLIKRKATNEVVLECTDVKEGTGKYDGMIGSIYCKGYIDSKYVEVWVGSGLTDHDREKHSGYYIGKKIEVLYNDVVKKEGANTYSLFLPRFKRIVGNFNV